MGSRRKRHRGAPKYHVGEDAKSLAKGAGQGCLYFPCLPELGCGCLGCLSSALALMAAILGVAL
jgi:hypothetical protein